MLSEESLKGCVIFALVVTLVIVVAATVTRRERFTPDDELGNAPGYSPGEYPNDDPIIDSQIQASPEGVEIGGAPERRSVYAALNRLYSTADVDPLVTGHIYDHADGVRNVYAQRTSHGDVHGLTEYSSSGGPGDLGIDIGPYGLDEYGGKQIGYDDGIPAAWALPSTPVRWYGPKKRDYYGVEGPTPYTAGMYSLQHGDHDPLVG